MAALKQHAFIQYAKCPNCLTVFGLRASQLNTKEGKLRCGNCFQLFNPEHCLVNKPPTSLKTLSPNAPEIKAQVQTTIHYQDGKQLVEEQQNTKKNTKTEKSETPKPSRNKTNPVVNRRFVAILKGTSQLALVASLLMIFTGQFLWFNRDHLAKYRDLRPVLQTLCHYGNCELPPLVDKLAFSIQAKDLRSHPHYQKSLRLHAIVKNNADFSQPYANLTLTFTDINGNEILSRKFTPKEYLVDSTLASQDIKQDTAVHIMLDLVDPGSAATGYTLSFN